MVKRQKWQWLIVGYDGNKKVFQRSITGALTESEIKRLLQRLASRHLTDDEVVLASLRKNVTGYRPDLEIRKNSGGRYGLMVGNGHHYIATIIQSET